MDRGYRKGLRIKPDRRRQGTWLGILIGAWAFIALFAWFDPFGWQRHRPQVISGPARIELRQPRFDAAGPLPPGLIRRADPMRRPFADFAITDAPVRYGTFAELESAGFSQDGPRSVLEAYATPLTIAPVGAFVRVFPVRFPEEHLVTVGAPSRAEPAWQTGKLMLANGCIRINRVDGPLAVFDKDTANLTRDEFGWLTVGRSGPFQLRLGEPGEILTGKVIDDPAPVRALQTMCGGGEAVDVLGIRRKLTCDMTRAQEQAAQDASTEEYHALIEATRRRNEERRAMCRDQGRSEGECARMPPEPPPPFPASVPFPPAPPEFQMPPLGHRTDCTYPEDL